MRIDAEKDFHGYRASEMLAWLEDTWSRRSWHGLQRVRLIHGSGAVLYRAARQWADEKGIPWATEPNNPGVTILHPARRTLPDQIVSNRLAARHAHKLTEITAANSETKTPERRNSKRTIAESEQEPEALMKEEFERLASDDAIRMLRRKRG